MLAAVGAQADSLRALIQAESEQQEVIKEAIGGRSGLDLS